MEHWDVVCPVAYCDRLLQLATLDIRDRGQQGALALWCDNWARSVACQKPCRLVHLQGVGEGIVQAEILLNLARHWQETSGDHSHLVSQAPQRAAQLLCPRREDKVLFDLAEELIGIVTLQQRDPRLQRLEEVKLPAHCSLGQLFDFILNTCEFSQLVDDLLLNQGAVHIKDNQPPHPTVQVVFLESDVNAMRVRRLHELVRETACLQLLWQLHRELQRREVVHGEPLDAHEVHRPCAQQAEDRGERCRSDLRLLHEGDHVVAAANRCFHVGGHGKRRAGARRRGQVGSQHLEVQLVASKE
mmetsp:Transcript_44094/g.116613  ORF Transcript_44094/g.116613 Transcript_44094/m.116613 type:complete len:301 (+) Transcript_44094:584-1486(+)